MSVLAIIPARSGSKGLVDKNIKDLSGHPLMYYTIKAAIESEVFDEIMVSTDSTEYKRIAVQCGASVPFLRSAEMSADEASSWDTVEEVLKNYEKQEMYFDTVCLLQPTSPLRTAKDIQKAYGIYKTKSAKAVVAVCASKHPPISYGLLGEDGEMNHFSNRTFVGRRQDYKTYYRVNGAIYFVDVPTLREDHFIYKEGSYAYIMNESKSIDIDDEYDFRLAEFLMNDKE